MKYQEITEEAIAKALGDMAVGRSIRLHTGMSGADMFQESMEAHGGLYRLYLGKKPPRIIKNRYHRVKKSLTGRYYIRTRREP